MFKKINQGLQFRASGFYFRRPLPSLINASAFVQTAPNHKPRPPTFDR